MSPQAENAPWPRSPEDHEWVELSLFCFEVPRQHGDPQEIKKRAAIAFGEGAWTTPRERTSERIEKLGGRLFVLRMTCPCKTAAARLTSEHFDHNRYRYECGLVARPPVVGLPGADGMIEEPLKGVCRIDQFVRAQKDDWLTQVVGQENYSRAAIEVLLEQLEEVTGRDFRSSVRWLGDVLLARRDRAPVTWYPEHSAGGKSCRRIRLERRASLPELVIQARVIGLDDVCLLDRLISWPDSRWTHVLEFKEEVGGVQLRAWSKGELAHESVMHVYRGFSAEFQVGGSSLSVQDRLTENLKKAIKGGAASSTQLVKSQRGGGRTLAIGIEEDMSGVSATKQIDGICRDPVHVE